MPLTEDDLIVDAPHTARSSSEGDPRHLQRGNSHLVQALLEGVGKEQIACAVGGSVGGLAVEDGRTEALGLLKSKDRTFG